MGEGYDQEMFDVCRFYCYPLAESVSFVIEDATFRRCSKPPAPCRQGKVPFAAGFPRSAFTGAYLKSDDVSQSASDSPNKTTACLSPI